jgi:hypothetical protein
MTEKRKAFVFVVCGDDKHIHTLKFSLRYLKHYSRLPVIVVTDTARNSVALEHEHVIDVRTPEALDHHQASIWLKTGLHNILPFPGEYCYLDSDVIALDSEVDKIFEYKTGPVTFAQDHCTLDKFSPSAVFCNCSEGSKKSGSQTDENLARLHKVLSEILPAPVRMRPELEVQKSELLHLLHSCYHKPYDNPLLSLSLLMKRFFIPLKSFRIKSYRYIRRDKLWLNNSGEVVSFNFGYYTRKVRQNTAFCFDAKSGNWRFIDGRPLYVTAEESKCSHLHAAVFLKFGIQITENAWQHWNGGVFLFDEDSGDFMDAWHRMTLEVFSDTYWRTRDQGTLAATVWKLGLQNQICLPREFNFIVDYYDPGLQYISERGFSLNNFKDTFVPHFVHIYHHFGHKGWYVWDAIENLSHEW